MLEHTTLVFFFLVPERSVGWCAKRWGWGSAALAATGAHEPVCNWQVHLWWSAADEQGVFLNGV